jgi:two-component system, NtrC family, response regulator PilR
MDDFQFLQNSFSGQQGMCRANELEAPELLLVEDDQILRNAILKLIQIKLKLKVSTASSPSEALDLVKNFEHKKFCLVTDISFDEQSTDGLTLIDLLRERSLQFESIVMTGFASIESAILATKKGVYHYLTKPFEVDNLIDLITELYAKKFAVELGKKLSFEDQLTHLTTQNSRTIKIEEAKDTDFFCGIIGRSQKMKNVFERIQKVANSDTTVLINGPSGTGKELVSEAIHRLSKRSQYPRISVNCGAIPSELLESELFGHEKGAFTGAISERKGRFELAQKGTLFLDEIGDMPLLLQVKLLRVLQNKEIERVGGNFPIPIDTRIVTATHRNLEKCVKNGDFREDLYYRLNVIPLYVPALCERKEDIPILISYFCKKFSSADGRNKIDFHHDTLELFMDYEWPGNVRELENLMERLIILRGGSLIKPSDLPDKFLINFKKKSRDSKEFIKLTDKGIDLKKVLGDIEDSLINQALKITNGNKNQASRLLSLNRTTLIEKMKKKNFETELN